MLLQATQLINYKAVLVVVSNPLYSDVFRGFTSEAVTGSATEQIPLMAHVE